MWEAVLEIVELMKMSECIVKKSICDICTPSSHCGLDVYVKDGCIEKVAGAKDFPSRGGLCMKGAANRDYVYRQDRIRTPMKRVGDRGDGRFEPVSWEEALQFAAEHLNRIKEESGPDAVAFYIGYEKWCRPWVERLAYSFGSVNYGTESSTCHFSAILAAITTMGFGMARPDLEHSDLFVGWGWNPYVSVYQMARRLEALKSRGGKVIMVDPRKTLTTEKLADLHLQIRPGTDGALMLCLANYWIRHNMCDMDYIQKYVNGFEAYQQLAAGYTVEKTSKITEIPAEQIIEMAELYGRAKRVSTFVSAHSLTHHVNGFNSVRNQYILQALRGQIDQEGGNLPGGKSFLQSGCGFDSMESEFAFRKEKPDRTRIGAWKYPIWERISKDMQATDLSRQILEGTPYPVRAIVNFGMNHRMFPQPGTMLRALDQLDFVVSTDLFWTDTCKHSDLVLPACSSLERSELKAWPGGFLTCTTPAIEPLYESRPDTQIICDLACALDLDDGLLRAGYDETMRYLISPLSVTLEELKESDTPIRVEEFEPYIPGTFLKRGFPTRSGKIELYSGLIASIGDEKLNPLPVYEDDRNQNVHTNDQTYNLVTGARLMHAIHSRLHKVESLRKHRPDPLCEIHPLTAQKEGIGEGDMVVVSTVAGSITLRAHLTDAVRTADIHVYHGYEEADANELIPLDWCDPYSGFPGYGCIDCTISRTGS